MSAQKIAFDQPYDLHLIIEPIFIKHFKRTHGYAPALAELKQHLAHTEIGCLVDYMRNENSGLVEIYSKFELAQAIQLYTRKLY